MTPLHHFAEPYAAQGNIDARAAARAIGRPQMDPWDVFLRETLQNSWDARLVEDGPITFSIDAYWPDRDQRALLKKTVFPVVPEWSDLARFLAAGADEQPVLVVSDIGTKGLGGPTRADLVTSEATDFVDFVRNVGRAVEKTVGGGTYGFGKGILWQMSVCSTVLVYSKSTFEGRSVSRFIAMGHTDPYDDDGNRYTGRHWWGRSDPVTKVEPLEGRDADDIAARLGMHRLSTEESGTAVMVLGPLASDAAESLEDIVQRLSLAALWWSWPHMVDKTISFDLTHEGERVEIVRPEDDPIIRHFAEAYARTASIEQAAAEWPWQQAELRTSRPAQRVGALVWRQVAPEEFVDASDGLVPIRSHVALMRRPRFVVRYLPVADDPHGLATVGVFVADGGLDSMFASAEPVAHDDWAPANMSHEKGKTNPVKRALEEIRKTFARPAVQLPPAEAGGRRQTGIVHLATQMGDLVSGMGDASFVDAPSPKGGGQPRGLSARVIGIPRLIERDGVAAAVFRVGSRVPESARLPVRLRADPYVLTESGRDNDSELAQPAILAWSADPDIASEARRGLNINVAGDHVFELFVSVPADTAVTLNLQLAESEEAP